MFTTQRLVIVALTLTLALLIPFALIGRGAHEAAPANRGPSSGGGHVPSSVAPAVDLVSMHNDETTLAPPSLSKAGGGLGGPSAGDVTAGQGEWNGIAMTVGTRYDSVLRLPTAAKHYNIEPISLNLRETRARVMRHLRLLYPQAKDSLSLDARLIWIDLGARFYLKGSTQWFVRYHPDSSHFEAALFDVLDLNHTFVPVVRKHFRRFEFFQKAAWIHDRGVSVKGRKMAHVKEQNATADPVKIANDNREEWTIDSIDMAAFLKTRYTKDDFVVLKMDIEGGEWEVLAHLLRTGAIAWVDELMLECHPRELGASVARMHQSCIDLINHFRTLGVATHRWI